MKKSITTLFALVLFICVLMFQTQTVSADLGHATSENSVSSVFSAPIRKAACSHNYQLKTTTQATCTTPGLQKYICTKCGQQQPYSPTMTIPALGHNYKLTSVSSDCHGDKCTRCGQLKAGTSAHKFKITIDSSKKGLYRIKCKCTTCSYTASPTKSVFIRNLNHNTGIIYLVGDDVDEFIDEMGWYLQQVKAPDFTSSFDKNMDANYGNRWLLTAVRKCLKDTNTGSMRTLAKVYYDYGTREIINCSGKVRELSIIINGFNNGYPVGFSAYSNLNEVDVISGDASFDNWERRTLK